MAFALVFAAERLYADDTVLVQPRASAAPAGYRPMCATIGHWAEPRRRRWRCSTHSPRTFTTATIDGPLMLGFTKWEFGVPTGIR